MLTCIHILQTHGPRKVHPLKCACWVYVDTDTYVRIWKIQSRWHMHISITLIRAHFQKSIHAHFQIYVFHILRTHCTLAICVWRIFIDIKDIYIHQYVHASICVLCVCVRAYIHLLCVCVFVCVFLCVCACKRFLYTSTCTRINIFMVCVCVCVCVPISRAWVCVCVCVCVWKICICIDLYM